MIEPRRSGIKKKVAKDLSAGKSNSTSAFNMVGLEQIPILKEGIRLISYIRKYLSLREKEKELDKRGETIFQREKKVNWLEQISKDNKDRVKNLVRVEIDRASLDLSVPRLDAYIYFANFSIFDLTASRITYDVELFNSNFAILKSKHAPDVLIRGQSKTQHPIVEDISLGLKQKIVESSRTGHVNLRFRFKYILSSGEHNISISSDEETCDYSMPIYER